MSTSIKKKQSQFPAIIREVEDRIVMVRGMEVIADADVAALYGVETKHVNQAVHNNPDKFPSSYMFELNMTELQNLRSKFLTTNVSAMNRNPTKVFTERGLYMLATILSGERAKNVTFAIIETFYKVRSMKRELLELHNESDKEVQNEKMKHFGETLTDIVMPDLETTETESSLEINFFIGKVKHSVKRIRKEK